MKSWISSFFKRDKNKTRFRFDVTSDGVDFHCDQHLFDEIKTGKAEDYITAQYVALSMLAEEGLSEPIPNGFIVHSKVISALDNDTHQLLGLPETWEGNIAADIRGTTSSGAFHVELNVSSPSGRKTQAYKIKGPCIEFGDSLFTLSSGQLHVFESRRVHEQSDKKEYANLKYLHALQKVKEHGANVSLGHFNNLQIHVPEKITVDAELDKFGNLVLTPSVGQDATHEEMQRVLGQILGNDASTIKVGNEIILFDEQKANATREIITNRKIPKSQIQQFLETPTAFLDASLVDLDVGFALRVKGATKFKHAYFGETDESGIDWFGKSNSENVLPFSAIQKSVKTKDDLQSLETLVKDAAATGAVEIEFDKKVYDIGSQSQVQEICGKLKEKIDTESECIGEDPEVETTTDTKSDDDIDDTPVVLDIELNDDELQTPSQFVSDALEAILFDGKLDWNNHKRTPFKHQEIGVKWILGLQRKAKTDNYVNGALLADDMGLGKTFMSLSAIEHYYRMCDTSGEICRPSLIVAPLSLLENWKDEVAETFYESPFKDIVILQSDGDLNKFREGSIEIRNNTKSGDDIELRYALKFGEKHGVGRLDLPKRLVITTYQTLRDYQFSLSQVDWGIVVFDEAQNVKNPNALQSRAAKGLKAKFKLMATGTPVENSLADFWCLMDTACPGLLDSFQVFRKTFILPILQSAGDEVDLTRAKLGRQLREKVGALMLRRIKEDNLEGLPEKRLFVGVNPSEFQVEDNVWRYDNQLKGVMSGYQLDVYDSTIDAQNDNDESHVLTTLMRLRDCSLHPRLVDGGLQNSPGSKKEIRTIYNESKKLSNTIEVLCSIQNRGEKCIIFAVNKRLQRFLSLSLGRYFELGPLHVINGDAKAVAKRQGTLSRKAMISEFEAKKGFNIIIMSPVAAGVGLTVVGANNVIHFERHWNPAKEAQATDRVFRIGQKKDVNIYVPILHHPSFESFDVNLHKLLSQKSMLKDAVITPGEVTPNPEGADKQNLTPHSVISFEDMSRLSWKQFEAFCTELLAKENNAENAWLTKDGADYGADGVITVDDDAIVIQVKHKKGEYRGYSAVQEVAQAAPVYQSKIGRKVTQKIFITNATKLSKKARQLAQELDVTVVDGAGVEALCRKHQITFTQLTERLNKKRLTL